MDLRVWGGKYCNFFLPYTKVYDDDNDVRNVHFHSEGGRVEGEKEIKKWKIGSVQHYKKKCREQMFLFIPLPIFHLLFNSFFVYISGWYK